MKELEGGFIPGTRLEIITRNFSAFDADIIKSKDLGEIDYLLGNIVPERERLRALVASTAAKLEALVKAKRDTESAIQTANALYCGAFITACDKAADNPMSDTTVYAMELLPLERQTVLLQDTRDVLAVRIANATDSKLEAVRDFRRVEHSEIALLCMRSHAAMLERLEAVSLQGEFGRTMVFSETTERLKLAAEDALRRAQLADKELEAFRAERQQRTQHRHADGLATRAETMLAAAELARCSAVPATQPADKVNSDPTPVVEETPVAETVSEVKEED